MTDAVEDSVRHFISTFVCDSHACIIQKNGVRSPPYTSKTRALDCILNGGAGINPEGGILYMLVPWSDDDIARAYYYNNTGGFIEL